MIFTFRWHLREHVQLEMMSNLYTFNVKVLQNQAISNEGINISYKKTNKKQTELKKT